MTVGPHDGFTIRPALESDVEALGRFIVPFVERGRLLPRTQDELEDLTVDGFIAESDGRIVGFACLQEDGLLLAGQGEVETASLEKLVRGRDRHHLEDVPLFGPLDAGADERLADAASLLIGNNGEAPQFGQLG